MTTKDKPEKIPNPGSAEAVRQGCTCAVWDNRYGRGVFDAPDGLFWITEDCPLHGKGTARWKIHE